LATISKNALDACEVLKPPVACVTVGGGEYSLATQTWFMHCIG